MDLGLSGLASGFDWKTVVNQLIEVERAPEQRLSNDQFLLAQRNNAYGSIKTQLTVLQTRIKALADPTLYDSRLAQAGDSSVASVSASGAAPLGSFTFDFQQLASAAKQVGLSDVGKKLSDSDVVSGVTLSTAGFSTAVTPGTFTVNGAQVSILTSDTLEDVFNKISTATGGVVTGSYSTASDAITLQSSSGNVVLGSGTDTSNFLQTAKLYNNGTGSVSSLGQLGGVRKSATLAQGNFTTAVSDGGAGTGSFKINGVAIGFSATADSLSNVIDRINKSAAGVTASFDQANDRILLTNKSTGDVGIALEDVTGNFLVATGLSGGTLQRGQNLLYSIDGGGTLVSQSNTIAEESSGMAGLTVTALAEESTTITVSSDSSKIKTALKDFLTEYNKAQSMIDTQTASTTDAQGKVTAGTLSNDSYASEIASALRSLSYSTISGLPESLNHLADIGIITDGTTNNLTLDDETTLDAALAGNLSGIQNLFANSSTGIATRLNSFVDDTIGDDGKLIAKQDALTKQSAEIDTQIADMERLIAAHKETLTNSFIAMETAQAKINQQLQFLQQRFGQTAKTS